MTSWITIIATSMLVCGIERGPEGPHGPRHRGAGDIAKYVERVAEAVDADEAQIAQLQAIAAEHKTAADAARAEHAALTDEQRTELKRLHQQVRQARRDGDPTKVEELRTQIHDIAGSDRRALMEGTRAKIVAVLTPEQIPAFEALAPKPGEGKGRGKGKGRGRRGGGPRDGAGRIQRFIDRVVKEVDATEAQQAQLKTIAAEHVAAMQAARQQKVAALESNRDELRGLREELREAREDGDREGAKTIGEKIRALRGAPPHEAVTQATFAKIAAVLTPEQLPAYEALVAEAKTKMNASRRGFDGPRSRGKGDGRGRRGPRGPRPGNVP